MIHDSEAVIDERLKTPANHRSRVLVVDDNLQNVELLEGYLEAAGYEVLKAYDGEEALEVVEKTNPHLILLDIMMPKLDGYQVCSIVSKPTHVSDDVNVIFHQFPEIPKR